MSKNKNRQKHRKRSKKQSFLWILLVLGGVFIATAAFLFARQGGDDGGTPSILVDQRQIDYGDQHFGTNLTFEIKVTNTGDGTLRFKEKPYIQVLEGC